MAPESSNQKRKRGQAPNASKTPRDATKLDSRRRKAVAAPETGRDRQEDELAESGPPRKRVRSNGTMETKSPVAPLVGTSRTRARPKGGSPEDPSDSPPRRSKRDRNSGDGSPWWEVSGISAASQPSSAQREKLKNRAARSSLAEAPVPEVQNRPSPTVAIGAEPKRKRGRPSLQDDSMEQAAPKRRRGRPSAGDKAPAKAVARQGAARRGGPRKSGGPSNISRPSPPRSHEVEENSAVPPAPEGRSKKQARSRDQTDSADVEASSSQEGPPAPVPDWIHLQPLAKHVPRATIAAKWTPLDAGALATVGGLLADAERSVLGQVRDNDRRRENMRSALKIISRRLRSRLAKGMPFPPAASSSRTTSTGVKSGHEDDLDFERAVDMLQSLEGQLDPLLHSVALLERERQKEEQGLEADYASLKTLENNARAEAKTWRDRRKKSHALAPDIKEKLDIAAEDTEVDGLREETKAVGVAFQDLEDEDLVSLASQIGSHMESLRSNMRQIDGIVPAITISKAALQEVLTRQLDIQQYVQLLLG